jgi:zinc protease
MPHSFKFPPVNETVLNNGLRLILIPDHEQDGFVIAAQFPFGRFCDPQDKDGTAEILMTLMQKGTKSLKFEQFTDKLDHSGATLFSDVGEEHTTMGIRMLSKYKDELVPVFFDMLHNPALENGEFKRIQQELMTAVQAETGEPTIIANRHFFVSLVGKEHPAGRFHTLDTIKKITLEDIKSLYSNYISPLDCVVVVAGDFEIDQFTSSYSAVLADWKNDKKKKSCFAAYVNAPVATFRLVDKPDLTQTTLVLGTTAPGELAKERNEIALANFILGGGNFSSRLMASVRSKVGKTYGIVSQIAAEKHFGAFTITTSTQNSHIDEVLTVIYDEFGKFCKDGVTDKELENAKRFSIGNLSFQLEGIGNIAEKILWLRFYGYTNKFIEEFDKMINSIELSSVNKTIQNIFSPEKLSIVAVGKKQEIEIPLKKYGNFQLFNYRDKI